MNNNIKDIIKENKPIFHCRGCGLIGLTYGELREHYGICPVLIMERSIYNN